MKKLIARIILLILGSAFIVILIIDFGILATIAIGLIYWLLIWSIETVIKDK